MRRAVAWAVTAAWMLALLSGCAGKQEDAKEETSQKVLNFGCSVSGLPPRGGGARGRFTARAGGRPRRQR